MLKLKEDKAMSCGESDFHYCKNIMCCKWYSNNLVLLLATNVHGVSGVSNIMRQTKCSANKTCFCPKIVKLKSNEMGRYNRSKSTCLKTGLQKQVSLLRVCFDLIDVTLVNSYIVYTKMPYN